MEYSEIDGIIFNNAHNHEKAIALYERAKAKLASADLACLSLNSDSLRPAIQECEIANGLIFDQFQTEAAASALAAPCVFI